MSISPVLFTLKIMFSKYGLQLLFSNINCTFLGCSMGPISTGMIYSSELTIILQFAFLPSIARRSFLSRVLSADFNDVWFTQLGLQLSYSFSFAFHRQGAFLSRIYGQVSTEFVYFKFNSAYNSLQIFRHVCSQYLFHTLVGSLVYA